MKKEWKKRKFGRFEYKISNHGDIVRLPSYISNGKSTSLRKEKELKGYLTKKGYLAVELDGKFWFVHRLVASLFIENKLNKEQVNHIDGNKLNNFVGNLEWCTNEENMKHAYKTGLQLNDFGEKARNFKYLFNCTEKPHLGDRTSMFFADLFRKEGIINNTKSCSTNIRTRLKVGGYNFKKICRKAGE